MDILKRIKLLQQLVEALTQLLALKKLEPIPTTGGIEIRQHHTTKCYDTPLYKANMIVGHIDLGTEKGTINEILNGSRSASYHWYIPKHAKYVVEFVPQEKSAWHAGVLHNPDQSLGKLLGGANEMIESGEPNRYSYGICYEGRYVTTEPNEAQVALAVELAKEKGIDHLPWVEHWLLTSYKPRIVTKFVEAVRALLKK